MIDKVKRKFKKVNREIAVIILDSEQQVRTEKGYLSRGTAHILIGRLVALKMQDFEKKDKLGRWSAFWLESNKKVI